MKKKTILQMILVFFIALMVYQPIKADAQWKQTPGKRWYYLDNDHKKIRNKWVGDYYLNANGYMVKNKWVKGKKNVKYFVGEDGKWIPNFNGGWYLIQNKWYFYTSAGKKQIGFITYNKNRYYTNENGIMLTGLRTINGKRYYFNSSGKMCYGFKTIKSNRYYFAKGSQKGYALTGFRTLRSKKYYFNSKGIMQKGWMTIKGNYYYFGTDGAGQVGWATLGGVSYYFSNEGVMLTGLRNIDGKLYYFDSNGGMKKNTVVTVSGTTYNVGSDGVCTKKAEVGGRPSAEMLFFTYYESGSASYGQTGGDNGAACGKYQFDYRYSLLPFVQYCYRKDPVTFKEFKTYASYTSGARLVNNTKFYRAWTNIFNRDAETFGAYQDMFAKQEYYDPVESSLLLNGINIKFRRDVVKGAVFSYSIQHGQGSALSAIINSGIKNSTSDKDFIRKLYNYRIKSYPIYKSRYTSEKAAALRYL